MKGLQRVNNYHSKRLRNNNNQNNKDKDNNNKNDTMSPKYNVLFLMFDMVSMAQFHRMMPHTMQTLAFLHSHYYHPSKHTNSDNQTHQTINGTTVYSFNNYNIVGEDSAANHTPFFAGNRATELPPFQNNR